LKVRDTDKGEGKEVWGERGKIGRWGKLAGQKSTIFTDIKDNRTQVGRRKEKDGWGLSSRKVKTNRRGKHEMFCGTEATNISSKKLNWQKEKRDLSLSRNSKERSEGHSAIKSHRSEYARSAGTTRGKRGSMRSGTRKKAGYFAFRKSKLNPGGRVVERKNSRLGLRSPSKDMPKMS